MPGFGSTLIQSLLQGFDIKQQMQRTALEQQAMHERQMQDQFQQEMERAHLAVQLHSAGFRPMTVTDQINQSVGKQFSQGTGPDGLPTMNEQPDDNQYVKMFGSQWVMPGQTERTAEAKRMNDLQTQIELSRAKQIADQHNQSALDLEAKKRNQFGVPAEVPGQPGVKRNFMPSELDDLAKYQTAQTPKESQLTQNRKLIDELQPQLFNSVDSATEKPAERMRLKAAISAKLQAGDPKGASDVVSKFAEGLNKTDQQKIVIDARGASSAGAAGPASNDPKSIAQAIMRGEQPPDTKGLYKNSTPVRAELARNGYNLAQAQLDWEGTKKHLSTMNGQQQERLRQAISFTSDSLDKIDDLYKEWTAKGLNTRFKGFNKLAIKAAKEAGGETGAIAQNLETQINDLTSELGTVYKGGNGSTDESLKLAGENLKGEWNELTFKRAMGQLRQNLTIRRNSIMNSQPVGVSENSPYAPKANAAAAAPTTSAAPNVQVGHTVKLRNGQTVTIKKINTDGTFDY